MRIIGKINKIKGEKAEFIPLDTFPEDTKYFKKIKNRKMLIENRKGYQEGELIALDEDISHKFLYRKIRKKKNMTFMPERGKYYAILENEHIKVLVDPEKAGSVDLLFDKRKGFEWFFGEFIYVYGKPTRCGISQGISERNLYEKKLKYKITQEKFYGRNKEKDFLFEKLIELDKNKLILLFKVNPKKEKEFYPFFDVKIFTNGEIYRYFVKIEKKRKIIRVPHLAYPFWGWEYPEEFGKVNRVIYEKDKKRLIIIPQRKNLLCYSFHYELNYFLNRFYYKKIKGEKFKLKLEVKV